MEIHIKAAQSKVTYYTAEINVNWTKQPKNSLTLYNVNHLNLLLWVAAIKGTVCNLTGLESLPRMEYG